MIGVICHVIDTVIQLYMIVGLGIRVKSMSVRCWRWTSLRLPSKASYCSKDVPQKGRSELRSNV